MKKIFAFVTALTVLGLTFANPVFAHVTVNPKETVPGYSVFTFRVPNEKEEATTEVRVEVPVDVEVSSVMPVSGWKYKFKREAAVEKPQGFQLAPQVFADHPEEETGRIIEITWSGGMIHEGEFMEFPVSAKYDGQPGKLAWKAYQTYEGGEVVPWDGSGEKSPAPTVEVMATSKVETLVSEVAQLKTANEKQAQTSPQWLTIGAFLLSVAALGLGLKGRGKTEK